MPRAVDTDRRQGWIRVIAMIRSLFSCVLACLASWAEARLTLSGHEFYAPSPQLVHWLYTLGLRPRVAAFRCCDTQLLATAAWEDIMHARIHLWIWFTSLALILGPATWLVAGESTSSRADRAGKGTDLSRYGDLPLVFSEDFDQGAERWETTDDAAWELREHAGGKAFGLNRRISNYQPAVRSPHNIALIKGVEVSDFVLKLRVKSTLDTGGHRDCCLFFGYQNPTRFYYVHLGARPDPNSGQIMIVDNAPRRPLTDNKSPVPWDDAWHDVKVVRNVATGAIEVYFDDMTKPLMTAVDKTFGKGRVGIGSFDDMDDFDDIELFGR